jgi:hypothetical protein
MGDMNPLMVGVIVAAVLFAGSLLGVLLNAMLPEHHLSTDSKDAVKLSMAMLGTLSALVVGLLIASAKNSFDQRDREFRRSAANLILMDRVMAHYGPETGDARILLRSIIVSRLQQMSSPSRASGLLPVGPGGGIEELQDLLRARTPRDDAQRWLQSRALQISGDVSQAQWMLFEQSTGSIQWPFLAILAFWLAVIFTSFGLFAPRNGTVMSFLFVGALSVGGSTFLIVDMDQPYRGIIQTSIAPLQNALDQLGR